MSVEEQTQVEPGRVQDDTGTERVCAPNPSTVAEDLDDMRLIRIPLGIGGKSFMSHDNPRREIRLCVYGCVVTAQSDHVNVWLFIDRHKMFVVPVSLALSTDTGFSIRAMSKQRKTETYTPTLCHFLRSLDANAYNGAGEDEPGGRK